MIIIYLFSKLKVKISFKRGIYNLYFSQMENKYFIVPELNNKISKTFGMLENLRLLLEIPRLYISNYFDEIRKEIDFAINEKFFKNASASNDVLNENWSLMIEKLHTYETAFLKNFPKNKFSDTITHETANKIEALEHKSKLILSQQHSEPFTEEYIQKLSNELNQLENEIYDETVELEKLAFKSMCFIFIDQKMCKLESCFEKMNKENTVGKLLIIKNEYFGKRGVFLIKK
jgi:hypothetical protein